jgi:transcriptional regulator with XRE-family HTH domain
MTPGERLRELRQSREVTQGQLAARAGAASSLVFRIEQGGTEDPNWLSCCRLADALGVDVGEFRRFAAERPAKPAARRRRRS